ncbi:MAG: hypothetical protein KF731_02485 [Thauera sp.]|nr:hypothetical protein [Thauera sp.]
MDRLAWRGPGLELEVRALSLAWTPAALLQRRVDIEHLTAGRVLPAQAVGLRTCPPLQPPAGAILLGAAGCDRAGRGSPSAPS